MSHAEWTCGMLLLAEWARSVSPLRLLRWKVAGDVDEHQSSTAQRVGHEHSLPYVQFDCKETRRAPYSRNFAVRIYHRRGYVALTCTVFRCVEARVQLYSGYIFRVSRTHRWRRWRAAPPKAETANRAMRLIALGDAVQTTSVSFKMNDETPKSRAIVSS